MLLLSYKQSLEELPDTGVDDSNHHTYYFILFVPGREQLKKCVAGEKCNALNIPWKFSKQMITTVRVFPFPWAASSSLCQILITWGSFSLKLLLYDEGKKNILTSFFFLYLTVSSRAAEAQMCIYFFMLPARFRSSLQSTNIIGFGDRKQQIVCRYSFTPFQKPSCLQELTLWGQGTGIKHCSLRRLGNKIG